jgi:ArsR family transcriptional regulator, arsenate/arsenite/antimonite-responsive transcriptional repressor
MKNFIKIFKALSDPTRLRVFLLLLERDLCVCEITFILEMSQSRVSHQLKLLRDADLVDDKREGQWIIYSIPEGIKESFTPLLSRHIGADSTRPSAALRDLERLGLCLRENIRKKKGSLKAAGNGKGGSASEDGNP